MFITCFADLHIGNHLYGSLDPKTGLNTRDIDSLKLLDEMINYSIDNNIKTIVFAGVAIRL